MTKYKLVDNDGRVVGDANRYCYVTYKDHEKARTFNIFRALYYAYKFKMKVEKVDKVEL